MLKTSSLYLDALLMISSVHHPVARSSITNEEDSESTRGTFATALPSFKERLLDHWVELKEAFGLEKTYNIVEITKKLAKEGAEWVRLRDPNHCKGSFIDLSKGPSLCAAIRRDDDRLTYTFSVLKECHPGATIQYKHGRDSYKLVRGVFSTICCQVASESDLDLVTQSWTKMELPCPKRKACNSSKRQIFSCAN